VDAGLPALRRLFTAAPAGVHWVVIVPFGRWLVDLPDTATVVTKPVRRAGLLAALGPGDSGRGPTGQRATAPNQPLRGRVLLVEDNPVNRRVGVKMLERLGLAADVAENGRAALEALGRQHYDVVLMDCQMPELDGFEATRSIRARGAPRRIPIIALTADAMPGDRDKCLAAGMDDYLAKPIKREGLRAALVRWLSPGARSE
jgi:CheY-like chemotaxis protein